MGGGSDSPGGGLGFLVWSRPWPLRLVAALFDGPDIETCFRSAGGCGSRFLHEPKLESLRRYTAPWRGTRSVCVNPFMKENNPVNLWFNQTSGDVGHGLSMRSEIQYVSEIACKSGNSFVSRVSDDRPKTRTSTGHWNSSRRASWNGLNSHALLRRC